MIYKDLQEAKKVINDKIKWNDKWIVFFNGNNNIGWIYYECGSSKLLAFYLPEQSEESLQEHISTLMKQCSKEYRK